MICTEENECGDIDCELCCPHDEFDHGICLGCGADKYEDLSAKAEFALEGDK